MASLPVSTPECSGTLATATSRVVPQPPALFPVMVMVIPNLATTWNAPHTFPRGSWEKSCPRHLEEAVRCLWDHEAWRLLTAPPSLPLGWEQTCLRVKLRPHPFRLPLCPDGAGHAVECGMRLLWPRALAAASREGARMSRRVVVRAWTGIQLWPQKLLLGKLKRPRAHWDFSHCSAARASTHLQVPAFTGRLLSPCCQAQLCQSSPPLAQALSSGSHYSLILQQVHCFLPSGYLSFLTYDFVYFH